MAIFVVFFLAQMAFELTHTLSRMLEKAVENEV